MDAKTIQKETESNEVLFDNQYQLVLWNDDVNTFDWVIQTLIDVCNLQEEQAEQCTLIIHYTGKCAVLTGDYNKLRRQKDAITERGINATVEQKVY